MSSDAALNFRLKSCFICPNISWCSVVDLLMNSFWNTTVMLINWWLTICLNFAWECFASDWNSEVLRRCSSPRRYRISTVIPICHEKRMHNLAVWTSFWSAEGVSSSLRWRKKMALFSGLLHGGRHYAQWSGRCSSSWRAPHAAHDIKNQTLHREQHMHSSMVQSLKCIVEGASSSLRWAKRLLLLFFTVL